ncbi:MAG TPA: hypothetical protein VHK90_03635 [Thermoanaerobaculia bacterium]|nr:hypothetical protein [Thermoanaerobaculia bacterium]
MIVTIFWILFGAIALWVAIGFLSVFRDARPSPRRHSRSTGGADATSASDTHETLGVIGSAGAVVAADAAGMFDSGGSDSGDSGGGDAGGGDSGGGDSGGGDSGGGGGGGW